MRVLLRCIPTLHVSAQAGAVPLESVFVESCNLFAGGRMRIKGACDNNIRAFSSGPAILYAVLMASQLLEGARFHEFSDAATRSECRLRWPDQPL